MTVLLAIDPGTTASGYCLYDTNTQTPTDFGKVPNPILLAAMVGGCADTPERCSGGCIDYLPADILAVEMIASYGMPVGAEVFETCVWVGRFEQAWLHYRSGRPAPMRILRKDVKTHLCGTMKAKDGNIRQALIDRYGGKAAGIGLKATPGPLYGFSGDMWAALGVAVTAAERRIE